MKLTNTIRDAFVRAAMQDVPEVDYSEDIRKLATQAALRALPPAARKLYEDEKTRQLLQTRFLRYGSVSVSVPGRDPKWNEEGQGLPVLSAADDAALEALAKKQQEQESTREALSKKLRSAAYAVSTRKALADMLPEFEKYLPADDVAANRSLPVVANIVADFTKAGWPKGKKVASKAKVGA